MDFFEVLLLIAIWISPTIYFITNYIKADKEDQKKVKDELKNSSVVFGLWLPVIGVLLLLSSTISGIQVFTNLGTIFLIISFFSIGIGGWLKKEGKFSENASLMLLGCILLGGYYFFI